MIKYKGYEFILSSYDMDAKYALAIRDQYNNRESIKINRLDRTNLVHEMGNLITLLIKKLS